MMEAKKIDNSIAQIVLAIPTPYTARDIAMAIQNVRDEDRRQAHVAMRNFGFEFLRMVVEPDNPTQPELEKYIYERSARIFDEER